MTARRSALPGFGLSTGYTVLYLGLIVLVPLSTIVIKTSTIGWAAFWTTVTAPRALASYRLTFGASLAASFINAAAGVLVAWVLVRYRFPGRRFVDALIDLPFALPTAVAGITLATLLARTPFAFSPLGVIVALTFVGLPFVVRTVEPVLEDLAPDIEEAAATLGASAGQTFRRVLFPHILPAAVTGFALAFARAVGEYGSVIFIAGNMPMRTEITPLLIVTKLEQFDYAGANALAFVMMLISFSLLLGINALQRWSAR